MLALEINLLFRTIYLITCLKHVAECYAASQYSSFITGKQVCPRKTFTFCTNLAEHLHPQDTDEKVPFAFLS